MKIFLNKYSEFLTFDGRHEIWVADSKSKFQIVWDNHNLLYVYENKKFVIDYLNTKAYNENDITITFPHSHMYHKEYDNMQESIIKEYDWIISEIENTE